MRKIASSGKAVCRQAFRARAEPWSRPKGFSTSILPSRCSPVPAVPATVVSNMLGGIAK